jgi:hypothetical protein
VSVHRGRLWEPWVGPGYPATSLQEHALIEQLRSLAAPTKRRPAVQRDDITAVMVALRTNLTCEQLFHVAPGLKPQNLVRAYDHVHELHRKAHEGATAMLASGLQGIAGTLDGAALLLPVPAARLRVSIEMENLAQLKNTFEHLLVLVDRTADQVNRMEVWLNDNAVISPTEASLIGGKLYNPYGESLWLSPYFLPCRVGQLSPRRLATLLGEK